MIQSHITMCSCNNIMCQLKIVPVNVLKPCMGGVALGSACRSRALGLEYLMHMQSTLPNPYQVLYHYSSVTNVYHSSFMLLSIIT